MKSTREKSRGGWFPTRRREPIWKDLLKKGAYVLIRAGEILSGRESRPLFVLGHMRSGSTLLLHLLVDHPEVQGYGERNLSYRSNCDLRRLLVDVTYQTGTLWSLPQYVVDQVNHNRLTPSSELIRRAGANAILLIRRPGPSIGSMVRVLGRHYEDMTIDRTIDHYESRLEGLARLSRQLDPATTFFLTYDDLLYRTEPVLAAMTEFLDLEDRIDDSYEVHTHTGRRGDPSETIRSGRIVREKSEHLVDLETEVRARLEERYDRLREELSRTLTSGRLHARGDAS